MAPKEISRQGGEHFGRQAAKPATRATVEVCTADSGCRLLLIPEFIMKKLLQGSSDQPSERAIL